MTILAHDVGLRRKKRRAHSLHHEDRSWNCHTTLTGRSFSSGTVFRLAFRRTS